MPHFLPFYSYIPHQSHTNTQHIWDKSRVQQVLTLKYLFLENDKSQAIRITLWERLMCACLFKKTQISRKIRFKSVRLIPHLFFVVVQKYKIWKLGYSSATKASKVANTRPNIYQNSQVHSGLKMPLESSDKASVKYNSYYLLFKISNLPSLHWTSLIQNMDVYS